MRMHHLLNVDDLKKDDIEKIMAIARDCHLGHNPHLQNKILATLFFEPSTRTKLSFHSAMYRMGGQVIDLPTNSSQKKGETDLDTVKTMAEYADVLVIRHPQEVMEELAAVSNKPVINAGESYFEHPTQALLDLYTIRQYKKDKKQLTIMFTGDLLYSRTVYSLVKLLKREEYECNFIFTNEVGYHMDRNDPTKVYMDESVIEKFLTSVDVLYMTRQQKERWDMGTLHAEQFSSFILTKNLVQMMKADAIIMHPLPRNDEIHPDVDGNYRAKYWQQVKNGLYVRMALLSYIL